LIRAPDYGATKNCRRLRNDDGTPVGALLPLSYYYPGGPYTEIIGAARAARGGRLDHVAVVGLGTGTLACHRKGREQWTFFEIDPEVIRIACDPRLFEFMSTCELRHLILRGLV
jgi:hypothetical protein